MNILVVEDDEAIANLIKLTLILKVIHVLYAMTGQTVRIILKLRHMI